MAAKPTYEELVKRIENLEQDTFKRKQAEKTQQESEAPLRSILRAVPIGIGVVFDRVIKEANERLCEILGYSHEEILGKSARMLYLTDEDFEYVGHEKYAQIYEKGIGAVETRLKRKDGNVIDVLLSSAPLDPKDLSIGVTFTVLDVTDRKQSERKLRKSEQKYRLLVESTPDWVWICDEEGRQTFSNNAVKQILGYEVQEILGTSAFNLMHPEERKRIQKWFQNAKNQKRGWKGSVIRWQHKDKSIRFLETIAEPILDAKGILTGFTGIDRDVTARKLSEEALRKAHDELEQRVKERTAELVLINENPQQEIVDRQHAETELVKSKTILKAVVDSLPFDVFALDPKNRYFLQNSISKKNWGDFIGKCPEDLPVNKETINLWMDNNRRALSGETVADEVEYHRLEGRKIFYYNIIAPIRDEEKIFGILGVLVDISKLKQAEEALRESEKRYRRLVETMNDGIGIQDENGLITYVNNKFCQMMGYKPDDFIGKPVTNFLDDHNRQILKNQTAVRRKGKVKPYEIEWTCKDGRKIQTIMSPQAIFNDSGQFKGSFSVITDISILKQVGDALWESKEQFRNLTEITSDWIWEVDKNACYTYVSPKIYDTLGYDPKKIIGKTPFDLMPPDEANRVSKIFNTIAASQEPFDCLENINLHKDGHPVVLETSGIPIYSADGESLGYRGIDRDITKRKQTEEALRESEERYRSLAENSLVGIWHTTLEGYTTYINPAMCSMLEIESPEELSGQTYHSFYSSENLKVIKNELAKRRKGISSSYEVEIKGKNGRRRNIMISGAPILSAEGKLQSYIATFTDITARKRAEKALQKAHDKLEYRVKERTKELEVKTRSLEEINTAMKVLLKKREEDKTEIEDNVLTNVKELVAPYFEKVKKTKLDDQQKTFFRIIESNLNEIISPFTRKMSLKYLNLTPAEIRIANLIRHGSLSKEIAELLNVSPRTVETHRKNIRRKIGLEGKRANLRTHLLSLH